MYWDQGNAPVNCEKQIIQDKSRIPESTVYRKDCTGGLDYMRIVVGLVCLVQVECCVCQTGTRIRQFLSVVDATHNLFVV